MSEKPSIAVPGLANPFLFSIWKNAMKTKVTIESAPLPLKPGTYCLNETVKNPKADRRIKQQRASNWESWPEWPTGMIFIVDANPHGQTSNRIYVRGAYHKAERTDPRFAALVMSLEPREETPSQYLARRSLGSGAGQLALAALDRLKIPIADLAMALDEIEAEEFAEEIES